MTTTQKTQPNSTVLSQGNAESYERGQGGATDINPDTLLATLCSTLRVEVKIKNKL